MKIFLKLIIFISLLFGLTFILGVNAEEDKGTVSVVFSEKIPGADCEIIPSSTNTSSNGPVIPGPLRYKCTTGKGISGIVEMMGKIVKYFTFIAGLGGVLFIVINGIMYSMSGVEPSMKDEAKKRIIATITGLILLLMSGIILKLVAPWIYV